MELCGLQKTTLLDYPGHVAATVFLKGCNFLCPFCHNRDLVTSDETPSVSQQDFFNFLKKRQGILEGVCISGGEPTLQPDLEDFIRQIRSLGYNIKLDTNGTNPRMLRQLWQQGLLDYVAMDIKSSKQGYSRLTGISNPDLEQIEQSVDFLLEKRLPYEFRTTVVGGLHQPEDFIQIGAWVHGCDRYFLQAFVDSPQVLQKGLFACSLEEMKYFAHILSPHVSQVEIRGIAQ